MVCQAAVDAEVPLLSPPPFAKYLNRLQTLCKLDGSNPFGASSFLYGGTPSGNVIDKFAYASDGNAVDVGDLTATRQYCTGQHF